MYPAQKASSVEENTTAKARQMGGIFSLIETSPTVRLKRFANNEENKVDRVNRCQVQ